MTTEKIRAALDAFADLLTALEPFGWDSGPLRARIAEAEGELAQVGNGSPQDDEPTATGETAVLILNGLPVDEAGVAVLAAAADLEPGPAPAEVEPEPPMPVELL